MADANTPNWLRPFSRLSRTSNPNLSAALNNSTPSHDNDPSPPSSTTTPAPIEPIDYPHNNHPHRTRPSGALRTVSSLLSLNLNRNRSSEDVHVRSPAPMAMLPLTEMEYDHDDEDDGFAFRFGARLKVGGGMGERKWGDGDGGTEPWHNPNPMQMVETLRVVMMGKRDALEGLPVAYNAYVLALIEGFAHLTERLGNANAKIAEAKDLREKELEQFAGISDEWLQREENYKAEIKRLELFLAKESKDGMASVALARSESIVDRAGSKRFHARVKRVSNSQNQDVAASKQAVPQSRTQVNLSEAMSSRKIPGANPRILDLQNDILMSRLIEQREREEQRLLRSQTRATRAAVRVGAHGVLKLRNMHHTTSEAQEDSDHVVDQDAPTAQGRRKRASRKPEEDGPSNIQPNDLSRFRRQGEIASDETSSSESGTSTETPLSLAKRQSRPLEVGEQVTKVPRGNLRQGERDHTTNAIRKRNERPGPTAHRDLTIPHEDQQLKPEEIRRKQPPGSESLLHEPFLSSTQSRGRSRGYSFDKGDDEVLPVTPALASQNQTQPWPSGERTAWAQTGEEVPREDAGGRTAMPEQVFASPHNLRQGFVSRNITPSLIAEYGSDPLSSSTGSVRWLGSEDKSGSTSVESNTGYCDYPADGPPSSERETLIRTPSDA